MTSFCTASDSIAQTAYRRRYIAALVFTLTTACSDSGGSSAEAIVARDSGGVSIVTNDLTQLNNVCSISPAPITSIGTDEGDDESTLFRVFGATRLTDGTIAVVNGGSHEVRFFAPDGQFVRAYGREGQGPGEFSDAFYIHWLPGDTLYVGDYRPFQFLVLGPDGQWVRTVRPTPQYPNTPGTMNVLHDGRMMLGQEERLERDAEGTFRERFMTIVLHANDGRLTDTIARMPNGRWGQAIAGPEYPWHFPLFESFAVMAARDERIVLGHASETELRVHQPARGFPVSLIIRWNAGDRTVLSEDISAERARVEASGAKLPPEMRARFIAPELSDKRPIAERFPAFGRLRIARDRRLWVREYPRPRDPAEHRWIAFNADGRFACRMTTPRFDDVLEFGADYVLTHEQDSLGVERVRQYTLQAAQEVATGAR